MEASTTRQTVLGTRPNIVSKKGHKPSLNREYSAGQRLSRTTFPAGVCDMILCWRLLCGDAKHWAVTTPAVSLVGVNRFLLSTLPPEEEFGPLPLPVTFLTACVVSHTDWIWLTAIATASVRPAKFLIYGSVVTIRYKLSHFCAVIRF